MNNIINSFNSISLEEMNEVSLLKRTDTKFLIHKKELFTILKEINNFYSILELKKKRLMTYKTIYFDTETKKFYLDHHNGKTNRVKIRIRKYLESNSCFLEIKQKDGKGKTKKNRIKIPEFRTDLTENSINFIKNKTKKNFILSPSLINQFNRITLVNKNRMERVTIDMNLIVKKNRLEKLFKNLIIIEVKQEKLNRDTPIINTLKKYSIYPFRISKYCIGMVSMYKDLKYNEFKSKFLQIEKLGA